MLFRASQSKPAVVFSVQEMLAYRDTWTTGYEDLDVDAKLHPPPAEKSPIKPLIVSGGGFKAGAASDLDKKEQLVRLVTATLNKITHENFEALVPPLLQPALFEPGVALQAVEKMFEKSLEEPKYTPLYAQLCYRMAQYEHSYLEGSKIVRTSIIEKAQEVYERQQRVVKNDEEIERLRKRKIANIKFVGHLVVLELLAVKIVARILQSVNVQPYPSELNVEETLCLVEQIGHFIDNRSADWLEQYFHRLETLLGKEDLFCNRVRFAIMNIIDLRKRKWVRTTPAELDPSSIPIPPKPEHSSAAAAPANVAASLEKRPPLPPPMEPNQVRDVTKALSGMTAETAPDVLKSLSTVLRDQNPVINRATCVSYAIEAACMSTKDDVRTAISDAIALNAIDKSELRAAQAWAAANSVASLLQEDCPRFYDRFGALLLAGIKDRTGYKTIIKEVFSVAASQIDAVYAEMEGGVEWDEAYIAMWSSFLTVSKNHAKTTSGVVPALQEILDALASFKFAGIASRTMTDVISAMPETGFCTYDDLKNWHANHSKSHKLQHVVEAMSLLV
jgi:hypothetical protein